MVLLPSHPLRTVLTEPGTQSIANSLSALLKPHTIHLSTPVSSITDSAQGVTVTSKSCLSFHALKLILSIPTPLYADLNFSPPLTGSKADVVSSTIHGYYSKMILCYSTPWWLSSPSSPKSCGLAITYQSPIGVIRDTSVAADGHYCLTCFIGGAPGLAWSKLPQHERRAQVLKQVKGIFGAEEVRSPVEVFEMEWSKEEYSKGAPCPAMGPGVLSRAGKALGERVGNIHFVGTETSDVWSGYMEGAVRSGERGAREVVES